MPNADVPYALDLPASGADGQRKPRASIPKDGRAAPAQENVMSLSGGAMQSKKRGKAPVSGSHAQHGYHFLREFLSRPGRIGAVAPSSPRLCKRMVEMVDLSTARVVVEYGPGTGVCTEAILPALPRACRFFAVE